MNEQAATPFEDAPSNVEHLPPPPRLRVVKALAEAEQNVTDVSARVAAAIEANARPKRIRKKAAAKQKKRDPILQDSTANVTNSQNPSVEGVMAVDEGAVVDLSTAALILQPGSEDDSRHMPAYVSPSQHVTVRAYAWVAVAVVGATIALTYTLLAMR